MKTNMRASGVPLVALVLALLTPAMALADTPREIAKRVSPSVVLLIMEDTNGQPLGMGSGFVVRDGIVATNMHVIEGAARGYAKLVDNETKHDIRGIVASDAARDLVLLSVDGLKAEALAIGDSKAVAVGDAVYAVGNPRGLEGTFSAGIVSSVRKVGDDSLLQITAPISPGSSGGPVVNSKGEMVGVAVATFKGGQNLNFAIPSQYLSELIRTIKAPVDLPKAAEARRAKKDKSILDEMGGKGTEGVVGGDFLWDIGGGGEYSFSLRNRLREPVNNVVFMVVFFNTNGEALDVDLIKWRPVLPPGLAMRIGGEVHPSVRRLTTRSLNDDTPQTRLEFRILYFDIVNPDEPVDEQSRAPRTPGLFGDGKDARQSIAATAERRTPSSIEEVQAELRESEKRLAEAAAKIAPAGAGLNLIESRIEGEFDGWDGETIFKLANGQIWQQVTYAYTYHYAYRPKVTIIKTHGAYKMKVDGVSGSIFVKRLAAENGEIALYGGDGIAAAYIVVGEKEAPIYLWSGDPVAYVSGDSVYGFNGKHIGWYRDGRVHDQNGKIVVAPKDKLVKAKEPDAKAAKKLQPLKGLKQLKPLKPLWGIGFSDLPAKAFFLQGRK